jgi:hypothetical protein
MNMATNKPCTTDLAQLSEQAIERARAHKARVLAEAELEQVAGGAAASALIGPIIWGGFFGDEILRQNPLVQNPLAQSPLALAGAVR